MTAATDPFHQFFTPERLDYYRDLHERYPLWCGDWPPGQQQSPDYYQWHLEPRLQREGHRLTSNALVPTPSELSEDELPIPRLVQVNGAEVLSIGTKSIFEKLPAEKVRLLEPPAEAALISAVYITLSTGSGTVHPTDIMEHLIERLGFALRTNYQGPGRDILLLRDAVIDAPGEGVSREKTLNRLHEVWIEVGREAGIIPDLQGGALSVLSDEFLCELADEASRLMVAVADYAPDETEKEVIRRLAAGRDEPLEEHEVALLEEMPKRKGEEAASRKRAEMLAGFDSRSDIALWARRLRFPMLTELEIRKIMEISESSADISSDRSAATLLEMRLLPVADTIRAAVARGRTPK